MYTSSSIARETQDTQGTFSSSFVSPPAASFPFRTPPASAVVGCPSAPPPDMLSAPTPRSGLSPCLFVKRDDCAPRSLQRPPGGTADAGYRFEGEGEDAAPWWMCVLLELHLARLGVGLSREWVARAAFGWGAGARAAWRVRGQRHGGGATDYSSGSTTAAHRAWHVDDCF